MSTFQTVAREFASAFVGAKRDDGTYYVKLRDERPAWLEGSSIMLTVHGAIDDRLPDDGVYAAARSIVSGLVDHACDDADEARETTHEIADGLVDVYNSARYTWLASHSGNADLCDEAVSEGLVNESASMADRIGVGQYLMYERIASALIDAIESEATSRDEDSTDE